MSEVSKSRSCGPSSTLDANLVEFHLFLFVSFISQFKIIQQ